MPANPEKLTCVSVLICDDVYRDVATQKLVVVGVFNAIESNSFPARFPRVCVLFSVTDGRGDYELSVSIQHERSGVEVLRMNGPFQIESPLAIADFDVKIDNLQLPEAGKYWVVVESDGVVIAQRPFMASLRTRPNQEPNQ